MENREFAVILEGLRSDFRAFREGLDFTNQRLGNLENGFVELKQEFIGIKNEFIGIKQEFIEIKKEFVNLKDFLIQYIDRMDVAWKEHEQWLKDHEVRLKILEKLKRHYEG